MQVKVYRAKDYRKYGRVTWNDILFGNINQKDYVTISTQEMADNPDPLRSPEIKAMLSSLPTTYFDVVAFEKVDDNKAYLVSSLWLHKLTGFHAE